MWLRLARGSISCPHSVRAAKTRVIWLEFTWSSFLADAPAAVAAACVAAPVMAGAAYSTLAAVGVVGPGATGLTWTSVAGVLGASQTWRGVAWTVATAGTATVIATALAALIAVRARDSRPAQLLAVLPMSVPHVAAALAALLMFGQSGVLSRLGFAIGLVSQPADFPALVYDPSGVSLIVAYTWKELPYLTLTALAVVTTRSDRLEMVARSLGATPRQAFRRVTWPLLWRGLAPAALAAFAFLIGQYEMPALLAPSDPTALPLLTYERAVDPDLGRRAEAHVLGLLALGLTTGVVIAHARLRAAAEAESKAATP